jgi:hypothetical protein
MSWLCRFVIVLQISTKKGLSPAQSPMVSSDKENARAGRRIPHERPDIICYRPNLPCGIYHTVDGLGWYMRLDSLRATDFFGTRILKLTVPFVLRDLGEEDIHRICIPMSSHLSGASLDE